LLELAGVLGLRLTAAEVEGGETTSDLVTLLVEVRGRLRRERQWELADLIRDRLAGLGIVLEDGKEGTTWRHDTN
jgi:cysteinyl-tRNA synthetase